MRTEHEISVAITRLKLNKLRCSQFNYFREDNHKRIDIMIDVLKHGRNEDFIYSTYQSQFEDGREDSIGHGNWQSAMIALAYIKGEHEIDDILCPEL